MKYLEKIQTLLPLGYLYLILLGLLKEGLQYHQLGINILNYSSITDILISPVAEMFANPIMIAVIILFIGFYFIVQAILVKNRHKNWAKKILGANRFSQDASKEEIQKAIFPVFILIIAWQLLSVFFGVGLSGGKLILKGIRQNDFTCNYKLSFNSGKSEDAYVFDMNSSYCFYITKGSKNIRIAPIEAISNFELINNQKLK